MGHQQNNQMVTLLHLEDHHTYSLSFFFTLFVVGDETKIHFWEDLWWGNQPLCFQFSRLFIVTTIKNLHISAILGNSTFWSWDLIFKHNLTDVEIVDLKKLMSLLSLVHFDSFSSRCESLGTVLFKNFLNKIVFSASPCLKFCSFLPN